MKEGDKLVQQGPGWSSQAELKQLSNGSALQWGLPHSCPPPPRLFTELPPIPIEMGLVASPQLLAHGCAFCEKQEARTFGSSAVHSTLNIYLGVQVRALENKKLSAGEGVWPGLQELEDRQLRHLWKTRKKMKVMWFFLVPRTLTGGKTERKWVLLLLYRERLLSVQASERQHTAACPQGGSWSSSTQVVPSVGMAALPYLCLFSFSGEADRDSQKRPQRHLIQLPALCNT